MHLECPRSRQLSFDELRSIAYILASYATSASRLVRCSDQCPGGETGRRTGLKIPGLERDVSVRFRSRAPCSSLLSIFFPQRLVDSLQTFAEHFCVHSHTDSKMVGQAKKVAGHGCGLVLCA